MCHSRENSYAENLSDKRFLNFVCEQTKKAKLDIDSGLKKEPRLVF